LIGGNKGHEKQMDDEELDAENFTHNFVCMSVDKLEVICMNVDK
jgi:hypothetical protein